MDEVRDRVRRDAADPPGRSRCARAATPIGALTRPISTASVSSCRTIRHRPAPSAVRIEISRCRTEARASSRLATLAHAISSTSVTAHIIARIISSTSSGSIHDSSGRIGGAPALVFVRVGFRSRRRVTPWRSALACAVVTPGFSRANTCVPRLSRRVGSRSAPSGIHSRCVSGNRKPFGHDADHRVRDGR